MADNFSDVDSEGVYVGMSLADFGVRVSAETASAGHGSGRGVERVPREQLRESIEHLQEELSSGEPLSREERARLEAVLGEVSGILETEGAEDVESEFGFDDLPHLVERFETTHPNLALVLGRIADALSRLGI